VTGHDAQKCAVPDDVFASIVKKLDLTKHQLSIDL